MYIRKYQSTDKHIIIELLRLNTPEYFSPNEEKDLIMYLDNFSDHYFVCELEGQLVGCGGFNITEDRKTAKISWDIIHPAYQGKGLGSELILFRLNKIKMISGIETVSVRTSQLTFKFYEKFGLELREIIKDFWDKGFDLYRLECSIDKILIV